MRIEHLGPGDEEKLGAKVGGSSISPTLFDWPFDTYSPVTQGVTPDMGR
jgi:hypothetical protein